MSLPWWRLRLKSALRPSRQSGRSAGRSLKPWAEGSDRDYRIRGRHSRRFYQYADQLLRSEVELSRMGNGADHGPDSNLAVAELREKIAQARSGLRDCFAEVEA